MKLIEFTVDRYRKEFNQGTVERVFDSTSKSRFTIQDEQFTPSELRVLSEEFWMYGQLSRIEGVEVAFRREDRLRQPDLVVNF